LRATLVRLGDEEHVFVLVIHHVAWDGWSRGVVYRDLTTLYAASLHGGESPLPQPALQYADFAVWQRRCLDAGLLDEQLDYWRRTLAHAPTMLELPTDHPRPPVQSERGARRSLWMSTSLAERLWDVSRSEGGTLFMTLMAALNLLLHRYTGQDDILVGTPIAGRNRTELEALIGYFTNTLVFRSDLSGDPTFRGLLRRVRDTALGAFANQDVPFERLVQELQPERSISHTPLFQVLFVHQNAVPDATLEFEGTTSTSLRMQPGTAKFDLTVGMGEHPEGLHASFEYCTDLFSDRTIEHMQRHFHTLLEGIAADPDARISELPILDAVERRRVLVDWNETTAAWPSDYRLDELVAEQAGARPDALAVACPGGDLSYAELNARADRLARRLRELGVDVDTPVGICMTRSLEFFVAVLATLKAGGACLPLDPAYPPARLEFMLRDSGATILLTGEHSAHRAPAGVRAIVVDDEAVTFDGVPEPVSRGARGPADLAYIIYTSGSTGEPRGVMLTHSGLVNHAVAAGRLYEIGPADRVVQFASISFDISVEEIFTTWLAGATLVPRPDDLPTLGPRYLEWLRRERVTVLDLPTAYWHAWVDDLGELGGVPEGLRAVIVGGERANAETYRRWLAHGGAGVRWFNTYGPTETSVVATCYEGPSWREHVGSELPIGRPIANVRTYVLDETLRPAPIGVPGELYIGGVGVARGYLNRPELTAARFVPDPFAPGEDARLYRSGDIVRAAPDGNLLFIGRRDDQIKVRGYRVEPGEVEAALRGHRSILDALVVADDTTGELRLVAYVVPAAPAHPPDLESVRLFLSSLVPDFMIPAAFVFVDAFPLTPNGKVDRDRLPEPDLWTGLAPDIVTPRNETEQTLASIWCDVLSVDQVGVHDNFFSLGGHSLLATRVVSRAQQAFERDLPLRAIFEAPTIAQLGVVVDALATESAPDGPALKPLPRARQRAAADRG